MSNTYFKMKVEEKETLPGTSDQIDLTAFVGGSKSIQITLHPAKNYGNCYTPILLTNAEATRLAKALMERVDKKISATDDRPPEYTDIEEVEEE